MALNVAHTKVVSKSNDPAYDVSADAWNENHALTGVASITQGGTGGATAAAARTNLGVGTIGDTIASGTAGSVLYLGASNVLAQDNSNFFYDYTNHRLGIGTATPGAAIHVNGAASGITSIFRGNATTPGDLTQWQSSTGTVLSYMNSAGNINVANGTATLPAYQIGAAYDTGFYLGNAGGTSNNWIWTRGVSEFAFYGSGILFPSDKGLFWISSTNITANLSPDIGIQRNAASVLKITDGSSGLGGLIANSATIGTTTAGYRLTVKDAAAIQGLFYGWSSIGGDGTHKADNGNGMIQLGLNAADHFELHFDDWGQSGNTHTYFDSTYNSASAAMSFRFRTAGTPVVALSLIGSGAVGIGATATTAQGLLINNASVTQLYIRGWSSFNGASAQDGQMNLGSYGQILGISNYSGGVYTALALDNLYDDTHSPVVLRSRVSGTAVVGLASFSTGVSILKDTLPATALDVNGIITSLVGVSSGTMTNIGVVNVQTSSGGIGNAADTTDDTLFTYSLPSNSMSANGKSVRVRAAGKSAANANTKDIKLWFAGTAIVDSGALALNNADWCIEMEVTRIDSTHVSCIGTWSDNGLAAATIKVTANLAVSDLTSNASVIKVTGASTIIGAANDVLGHMMKTWFEN